jgi:hypothetical protein
MIAYEEFGQRIFILKSLINKVMSEELEVGFFLPPSQKYNNHNGMIKSYNLKINNKIIEATLLYSSKTFLIDGKKISKKEFYDKINLYQIK